MHRLCQVLGVRQSGCFASKDRPASRRQCDDMVMLAHVRSAFALSNGTYGSPRMTRERRDDGFAIGRRRTAPLMRENGLRGRPPTIAAEKLEAVTTTLAGGASKAAVCRNFGIARSTLIGTLERIGWVGPTGA